MSKIRRKKVVFFYDKYVNSTIMVDSFYWERNEHGVAIEGTPIQLKG